MTAADQKQQIQERHDWENIGEFAFGRTRYTLEHNRLDSGEGRPIAYAYRLTGVRGAQYLLMRNMNTPTSLFAINARSLSSNVPFGNGWFTDRTGTLEHAS